MIVKLTADRNVILEDHDDFRAFKVVIEGTRDLAAAREALAGHAELVDESTAWVKQDSLRTMPEVSTDTGWQQAFVEMIDKARPHGWIDDSRKAIKAHVEWIG